MFFGKYDSLQVSRHFIVKSAREKRQLNHAQLQNLLYYAQGFYCALHPYPLFHDRLYANEIGSMVLRVNYEYGKFIYQSIPVNEHPSNTLLDMADMEFLDAIWTRFKEESTEELEHQIRKEAPWKKANLQSEQLNQPLWSQELMVGEMRKYFRTHYIQKED